jgi:hypothetical protein
MADIPVGTTDADKSAKAMLAQTLSNYGLDPSLVSTLWDDWHIGQGKSIEQVMIDIPQTTQFQARFPRYAEIQKAHPGFGVADYINYENAVKEQNQRYGLPDNFYSSGEDIANNIIKGVSASEREDRVKLGVAAAIQSPVETRSEMARLYGVDLGHLAAYFIDPARAEPELQKQVAAAAIGGSAVRSQFGLLSRAEAESIAQLGLSEQEVGKGFADLYQQQSFMQVLPGQGQTETAVSREQQLAGQFGGDAAAQEAVLQQQRKRQATFAGGGAFQAGQKGVGGLGQGGS